MIEVVLVHEGGDAGTCEKLAAHVAPGRLHRAVSVVAVDRAGGRVLVQRRAAAKYHFGRRWSNTSCTHPLPGEPAAAAAARCLGTELGATLRRLELAGTFTYRADDPTGSLVEHEVDDVFVADLGAGLAPAPAEVDEVCWADGDDLARMFADPDDVTPWFGCVLRVAAGQDPDVAAIVGDAVTHDHPNLLAVDWSAAPVVPSW